jgi:para-nitrobenzyl esterase
MGPGMQVTLEVNGVNIHGYSEGNVSIFRGIPYAMPPTEKRRFLPPEPFVWSTTEWHACEFSCSAIQSPRGHSSSPMVNGNKLSEDCLYLNVFTPDKKESDICAFPVLVWLHGGSSIYGIASQKIYDGHKLASEGMVVVTVNYRLGAFGYLELGNILGPEYAGSGNNATRDQLLALKWVRENISSFNGDPERITLAGESAGAKAVCNLLALSETRHWIQSAIISSGTADCVNTLEDSYQISKDFVNYLGIENNPKEILKVDAQSILNAQVRVIAEQPQLYPFRAVVDNVLLQSTPIEILSQIDCSFLNILAGFNHDDGWFQMKPEYFTDPSALNGQSTYGKLTHHKSKELLEVSKESRTNKYDQLSQVSDLEYIMPCIRLMDILSTQGANAFLYQFNIRIDQGPFSSYCVHASDLPYVWRNFDDNYMDDFCRRDAESLTAGLSLNKTWVNFIKTGKPTGFRGTLPLYNRKNRLCLSYDINGISDISHEIIEKVSYWDEAEKISVKM